MLPPQPPPRMQLHACFCPPLETAKRRISWARMRMPVATAKYPTVFASGRLKSLCTPATSQASCTFFKVRGKLRCSGQPFPYKRKCL